MKKFVKSAAFAVALILVAFSQQAMASVGPHSWYSAIAASWSSDNSFSIELNRKGNDEVILANIENPGRKNLSITLSGPDGGTIDNFYTGRKLVKMNKTYNFTGAEEGVYTIVISDGVQKIKKQVKLQRTFAAPISQLIVQ